MNKTGQLVITASLNATGMDSFCSTGITSANETYLWRKKKKKEKEEEKNSQKDTGFVLHVLRFRKGLFS